MKIEVNSTEENIRIKTEYPNEDQTFRSGDRRYENPATVEYALTVPRKAVLDSIELVNGSLDIDGVEGNVKASSINGRVFARGLMGEARLSTINGPLQATFTQLDETKPISLGSVNGTSPWSFLQTPTPPFARAPFTAASRATCSASQTWRIRGPQHGRTDRHRRSTN